MSLAKKFDIVWLLSLPACMRRHMGNDEDHSRISELLKSEKQGWKRDRLIALKMGFSPGNSVKAIAATIGSSVPTVQRWFDRYRERGLEAALTRNYGTGRPPKLNERIVELLESGLRAGRWNTAVQAQRELEARFGRSFPHRTVLHWLKKLRGSDEGPLPRT